MKKIVLAAIAAALSLTACLKNDTDYFDQSASERGQVAVEQALKALQSAQNGWRMEVYPFPETADYGGFNLFVKFTDKEVTAMGEVFGPDVVSTSFYSLTQENGPMLSFDTYNDVIHFFADPGYGANQDIGEKQYGLHGDTDFIVMEASPEFIKLKGRITNNYAYMYPLEPGVDWTAEMNEYLTVIDEMDELVFNRCTINGEEVDFYYAPTWNNFTSRWFELEDLDGNTVDISYILTKTGVKFYVPVKIAGEVISEMTLVDGWYLSSPQGTLQIFPPEPIRSDNTFSVSVTDITYKDGLLKITPSITSEYFYWDCYPTSQIESMGNTALKNALIADLNSYFASYGIDGLCDKGVFTLPLSTYYSLKPETSYTVIVFGTSTTADGKSLVGTTKVTRYEFTTAQMPPLEADYSKWLGEWTVTSTSSMVNVKPLSFPVKISIDDPNESYLFDNLSIASLRSSYSPVAMWDKANDQIAISQPQVVGQNANGYDITYRSYYNAGTAAVPARGFISGDFKCLGGVMTDSTHGQLVGYTIGTTSGASYLLAGMDWFAINPATNGIAHFTSIAAGYTAYDYAIGPYTMVKTASYSEAQAKAEAATRARAEAEATPIKAQRINLQQEMDLLEMHMLCTEEVVESELVAAE